MKIKLFKILLTGCLYLGFCCSMTANILRASQLIAKEEMPGQVSDINHSKGYTIWSPDENLKTEVYLKNSLSGKCLCYSVKFKEKTVVLESALGITPWADNKLFTLTGIREVSSRQQDTVWTPLYGERSILRDHYYEKEICLFDSTQPKRQIHLIVRAFNEGIAFRYYIPEHTDGGENIHITSEQTEFVMPKGSKAWFTPIAQATYELMPLSGWPGECERPLTLELPNGLYACLTEAEMVNYARTKFALSHTKANTITCSMYGSVDETTPFYTPWRVIMIAEKPGELLEHNDLIQNLNPPSKLENTWWIRPGKVMREMTLSTMGAIQLVDFAVKRNLQYIHLDAGWYGFEYSSSSDATTVAKAKKNVLDIPKVVEYARKNGIGVFLYVNQRVLAKQLDEILPLYQKWGISGIKFGFVHVGSHRWTTWLHEAVKKCAEYRLMVDIHDEYRPTGFSRTYPNLMTQEGIYGNEGMPDATHNATLPFTRFIAGPADYTICYYNRRIKTTNAHQLALSVVFYSPLQFLYWYGKPKDYHDEPELDFFDKVHTVWDDSRVIQGEIGQYITVARKSGGTWFLGTITGNKGRNLKTSLNFLDTDKKYVAHIFSDGIGEIKAVKSVKISCFLVDCNTVMNSVLKDSGGEAVYFTPATIDDQAKYEKYK